nr:hypothetical protein [Tanacetum cinerariifolium]
MHEDFYATAYPDVHKSLKLRTDENFILKVPTSPSGTLSSMKNLDDTDNFGDDFLNDVPTEDEPANTSAPPCSTTTTKALLPPPPTTSSNTKPHRSRDTIDNSVCETVNEKTITDTRDTSSSSFKQWQTSPSGGPTEDVPIPDEVHNSYTKDIKNSHLLKIMTIAHWFRTILEEERPATPEPEWPILPNDFPKANNSWANAFATTYQDPEDKKLLRKTGDMGFFIKWFCKRIGKKKLSKSDLEGPAFNVVKGFHKNSISL